MQKDWRIIVECGRRSERLKRKRTIMGVVVVFVCVCVCVHRSLQTACATFVIFTLTLVTLC